MIKNIFILIAFSSFLFSCDKFLEEVPTGQLTTETQFTTSQDGNALIIGPYRSLANWTSGATDWGNYLPGTLEYPTGFAWSGDSHIQLWRFESNQVSGDLLDDFNNQWMYWYQGVRDCNFSLERLPGITEFNDQQISSGLGEIRTLRAWYYFNLVRYFGDVILNDTSFYGINDLQQPRTSLKTIYDQIIIPDLEFAVNQSALPEGRSTDGRVTKDVARAILADVYLTAAGYPYQEVETNPTKNWCAEASWSLDAYPVNSSSAKDFLKKAKVLLDNLYGKYQLGTYDDLHDPNKKNQGEFIFQVQYKANVTDMSGFVATALPITSHISMFGDEYGTFIPSAEYLKSFDPDDKRIQDRQMIFYSDHLSTKYDPTQSPAAPFSQGYLFKYYDEQAIKVTGHSDLNWTHYRYADMLLMLTEVNWSLRQLGEAVSDNDIVKGINEVRHRAELGNINASDLSLLDILSERAYELIFENKMIWDQRRTRKCLVMGNGKFDRLTSFIGYQPPSFSFAFGAMNLLSPIPGREILNNTNCLQNGGYLPKQGGQ